MFDRYVLANSDNRIREKIRLILIVFQNLIFANSFLSIVFMYYPLLLFSLSFQSSLSALPNTPSSICCNSNHFFKRKNSFNAKNLFCRSFNGNYLSIGIIFQLHNFQAAQPGFSIWRYAVVMKKVPFTFKFNNWMMGCPAYYWR